MRLCLVYEDLNQLLDILKERGMRGEDYIQMDFDFEMSDILQ
jgi:hypothetical protein